MMELPDGFLAVDPDLWEDRDDYNQAAEAVESLKVVNDHTERGVALLQEYSGFHMYPLYHYYPEPRCFFSLHMPFVLPALAVSANCTAPMVRGYIGTLKRSAQLNRCLPPLVYKYQVYHICVLPVW